MSRLFVASIAVAALALAGCAQGQEVATDEADQDLAQQAPAAVPEPARQAQAPRQQTPPPAPKPRNVSVASGTLLDLSLSTDLDSGVSQVGDAFTAEVVTPVVVDGREVIPAGSTVHGTVSEVVKAKRGAGKAKLVMAFDRLTLPGGYSTDITATLSEQSASKKKRNAAVIGGSAAGGALLGKIVGKDTKAAVVGSIVGGAIGTGVVMSKEGEQVSLPAGTPIAITLDQAVRVPARS